MALFDELGGMLTGGSNLGAMSSFLGEDESKTSGLLGSAVPALLGGLGKRAQAPGGADALLGMVNDSDDGILDNIGGLLSGGDSGGVGSALVGSVLGGRRGAVESGLAQQAGVGGGVVSKLLPMLAPLAMGFLKRKVMGGGLNAGGLASMLGDNDKAMRSGGLGGILDMLDGGDDDEDNKGFASGLDKIKGMGGLGALGGLGAAGAGAAAMASGKMGDMGGKVGDMGGKVTGKVGDMGGKVTGSVGDVGGKVGDVSRNVGGRVEAPKASGGLPKWLIPLVLLIGLGLLLWWLFSSVLGGGDDLEELNVAYFSEWPTPNQVDQFNQTFDDELGIPVNWVSFGSGNDMSRAMEAGDIDISYSQGLTPFVNAVNEGSDFEMVGIAVSYTDNDNCVATGDANITPENASEALKGATIMSLLGNVTEFKMQKMLEFFGVDQSEVTIVGADDGAAVLAAYERGDIDVGCAFGGPLFEMLNSGGNFLWTGEEAEAAGVLVFDVTTIPAQFGADHPDVVTTFLQITEDANEKYKANAPYGPDIETLAQAAGLDVEGAQQNLDKFTFPDKAAQLSDTWLAAGANEAMLRQGGDAALDDYQQFINTSFLEATE